MAVDSLNIWKSTLSSLPKVTDGSWSSSFSSWYANRIIAISPDPSVLIPAGFLFTFNVAIFSSMLSSLTPVPTAAAGILGFANAWEAALLASTAVMGPGSALVPPSPPTIFSVVITTVIDPASIALGKAKLLELVTAPPETDANNSLFPEKFRDATLLLTITVTGLDSTPIPAGPLPLVAASVPLT